MFIVQGNLRWISSQVKSGKRKERGGEKPPVAHTQEKERKTKDLSLQPFPLLRFPKCAKGGTARNSFLKVPFFKKKYLSKLWRQLFLFASSSPFLSHFECQSQIEKHPHSTREMTSVIPRIRSRKENAFLKDEKCSIIVRPNFSFSPSIPICLISFLFPRTGANHIVA